MNILYTNVIEQNAGWGAEFFVNRGFNSLGHDTFCIDFRKHRDSLPSRFLEAPVSDVFLLQRGDYFPIPILKAIKIPRFFWASELVSRCRDQDPLIKSGLFKHIFLHTNACLEAVVDKKWADRSILSVLLNGFDESVFKPDSSIVKDIDILFVGSITERRKEILELISRNYQIQIVSAFGQDMAEWINRSKIILNFHAEEYPDTETRVFEVLGCGGFLLTEKLSHDNPFIDDELVQFDTIEDCLDKLSFYLKEKDLRETIARKGYQAAINKHTYTERAREIVEIMLPYVQTNEKYGKNPDKLSLRVYELDELVRQNLIVPGYKMRYLIIRKIKSILKRI